MATGATTQGDPRLKLALLLGSPRPLSELGIPKSELAKYGIKRPSLPERTQRALMGAFVKTIGSWSKERWSKGEN
jgi:hypothetical protein